MVGMFAFIMHAALRHVFLKFKRRLAGQFKRILLIALAFLCLIVIPMLIIQGNISEVYREKVIQNILESSGSGKAAGLRVLPAVSTVAYQPSPHPCKNHGSLVFTLFMVISSPERRQERADARAGLKRFLNDYNDIRLDRWELHERINMMVFFVGSSQDREVQESLELEASLHQDIVIDNMTECYLCLTLKTLRMFKWVRAHCPKAEFVVKIDDDVHLNLQNFFVYVASIFVIEKRLNLVGGHLNINSTPNRDPSSKWFVPVEMWPGNAFPDYVNGYFCVLGRNALEKIYSASLAYPLFHLEDVFVTGIVGTDELGLGITAFPAIENQWTPMKHLSASSCTIQKTFLAVHFRFPFWNYLRCWKGFNSKDFVCSRWPLILSLYC